VTNYIVGVGLDRRRWPDIAEWRRTITNRRDLPGRRSVAPRLVSHNSARFASTADGFGPGQGRHDGPDHPAEVMAAPELIIDVFGFCS
jgi:hypothetical protein